jgi:glycerol-3-phosphate acyltransferase PlsY
MADGISATLWLAASYLLGAIPTSYVAGKALARVDLRQQGSRNLGATNVYRVLGWKYAIPVGLFDVAKGAIPVLLFGPRVTGIPYFPVLCGIAAVLGHVYSVFVGFKGGKGMATAAGVLLALVPTTILVLLPVWALTVWATGYVSLGSIVAAALFPVVDWLLHPGQRGPAAILTEIALAGFLIFKHRANIRRLLAGTENRFGRHGSAAAPPSS